MKHRLSLISLIVWIAAAPAIASDSAATLSRSEGEVTVQRGGETLEPRLGKGFSEGDEIVTGAKSGADIAWAGLWGCRILENTRAKVISLNPKDQRVGLEKGTMLFRIDKLPRNSRFQLETPTAVAVVRGTQFLSRVSPDGKTMTVAVLRGRVEVKTSADAPGGITFSDGQAVDISSPLDSMESRPLTDEETNLLRTTNAISTGRSDSGASKYR